MANEAARLLFTLFASCRKAAIAKALHSKGVAFSSHLHKNREALLVKTLHFITLVKPFRCAPARWRVAPPSNPSALLEVLSLD